MCPAEEADEIWGELAAATVYTSREPRTIPPGRSGARRSSSSGSPTLLPEDVGKPLGSAVRCAAAIIALASDSEDPSLRAVLSTTGVTAAPTLKVLAGLVLGDELVALLEDEGLIPAWIDAALRLRGDAGRHARLGRFRGGADERSGGRPAS